MTLGSEPTPAEAPTKPAEGSTGEQLSLAPTPEAPKEAEASKEQPKEEAPKEAATPDGKEGVNEKPAAEKPAEQQQVVPEKYELKLPEGSLLHAARVESLTAFAKEQGFSNAQAQALLDRENSAIADYVKGQSDAHTKAKEQWRELAKADKEIGGESFAENVEAGHRALKKFGSELLIKQLEDSGYGNYPELVRMLSKIGKAMSNDTLVLPGTSAGEPRSHAEVLYGKTTS